MPRSMSLVAWRLCALRFIETFGDTISLQPGEPIDPKDPIELIDLVLETIRTRAWRSISSVTPGMETLPSSCRIHTESRPSASSIFSTPLKSWHVGGSPDDLRVHIG